MQPPIKKNDDEDFGAIDLEVYRDEENQSVENDLTDSAIDMDTYSDSQESKEASWWDWTKDVAIQGARGVAQAFTWPLDVLKIGVVGSALSDIDELEEAFRKAGKPFDRDEYTKFVLGQGEFVPTQSMFEGLIESATGVSLEPTTESGKFVNKAATIASLTKGGPLRKLAAGSAAGTTTQGLKSAGVNEFASEVLGDIVGGGAGALKKGPRKFTPEAEKLRSVADKHDIPFYEFMTRPEGGVITPKISQAREAAISKELGLSSEQAAQRIIDKKIPISELRKEGVNLDKLQVEQYDKARQLAASKPQNIDPSEIISDIDREIKRLKSLAPSPSHGTQEAINILEKEKSIFEKSLPSQKDSNPINSEQLINQHIEYNKNVKGLYKKPELAGKEEDVRNTYAFLNESVRKTMEKQAGSDVAEAFKEANKTFSQNAILKKSESVISKAFEGGNYNPKKLSRILNSRQGSILRRDLGDKAVGEIREIAEYGQKAVDHTSRLLKSPQYAKEALTWGSLAPFILGSTAKMTGLLYIAKPMAERVKGYLLTRPATRQAYNSIIKKAAKGSFKNMASDFSKLEKAVSGEFGSSKDLIKKVINDLEVYEGDF